MRLWTIGMMTGVLLCGWLGEASAYLDPGGGSYFFQILIGGVLAGIFTFKSFWRRLFKKVIAWFGNK
ncbi:MAG: hypothetical protein HY593_04065 [Candidatus Omnitrophica bacterium]|nr:hypothetical protein [Candidatus Omnitrophota bacterium]